MKAVLGIVAFAICFTELLAAPSGEKTAIQKKPGEAELAMFNRFAGEWTVQGKWSGGEALEARAVYEWSLDKRILVAKTFVKNGATEYQRYEGIMTWHPEKKTLFQTSFAYDGAITETIFDVKDKDTFHIGYTPFQEGKPSQVRQVIRFLDNDHFQWTVSLNNGKEWQQLIDATWVRKSK
jgi:hypothetical protein